MKLKKIICLLGMTLAIFLNCFSHAQDNQEKNIIALDAASLKMADIKVITLQPHPLTYSISAPGEVIPNANSTTKMTSRVAAQVIKRYVQEGQHVKLGQPLVELSSVDMAKTQGDLLLASEEWERLKNLGRDAISAKRYSEAQVAYQRAYSTALAYGMTEKEISELLRTQKTSQTKGEFKLLATRDGTIFNLNVTEGELVEPGRILLQIVEEKNVWIDAKLPPDLVHPVKIGDAAQLVINGYRLNGQIIQVHHQLDETTRTRSVTIEVPNTDDALHSGQFVNVQIEVGKSAPVLALPVDAVIRTADNDWAIFIETQPGKFQQVEIKVVNIVDNQSIIEGVAPGTRVVTRGAFFIHAELNKKGLATHGH